ncbi:MAG: hypothetical protein IJ801_00235 [Lachnospiraceae bacterium]|nr:hypothetical protein [Lachnospiraceae bacterium]
MKESAYSVKSVSMDAIIACVLSGLSICCLLGALLVSYLYGGKGPAAVGLLGIGSLLLALVGIAFTVSAWKSQDGGLLMKRIAGILNALPFLAAIILYIYGWM